MDENDTWKSEPRRAVWKLFDLEESMRKTPRSLADARKELLEIQQEFVHLQKRIDAVRDCVTRLRCVAEEDTACRVVLRLKV